MLADVSIGQTRNSKAAVDPQEGCQFGRAAEAEGALVPDGQGRRAQVLISKEHREQERTDDEDGGVADEAATVAGEVENGTGHVNERKCRVQ